MSTLLQEIIGVREVLGNPLENSPSYEDISEALAETYQTIANIANNTGNAWQVSSFNLAVTAGTRTYLLDPTEVGDFFKPLLVTTVPEDLTSEPEYILRFTEIEHLPQEWSWLSQNSGYLLSSSHSSQVIAFYRTITGGGEGIYCELRPTPNRSESYKILYQIGDWWERVFENDDTNFRLPHKEFRFHFRRQAALLLIESGKVRWSYDAKINAEKEQQFEARLNRALERNQRIFDDYIASLDNADVVKLESYADTFDFLI